MRILTTEAYRDWINALKDRVVRARASRYVLIGLRMETRASSAIFLTACLN